MVNICLFQGYRKGDRKNTYQASKTRNYEPPENNLPYVVSNNRTTSLRNHGLYATPFSAPWQRYSKPKFKENMEGKNL